MSWLAWYTPLFQLSLTTRPAVVTHFLPINCIYHSQMVNYEQNGCQIFFVSRSQWVFMWGTLFNFGFELKTTFATKLQNQKTSFFAISFPNVIRNAHTIMHLVNINKNHCYSRLFSLKNGYVWTRFWGPFFCRSKLFFSFDSFNLKNIENIIETEMKSNM